MEIKTKVINCIGDKFSIMYNGKLKWGIIESAIHRKAKKIISYTNAKKYTVQYNFDSSYQSQPGIYYIVDVVVDWTI